MGSKWSDVAIQLRSFLTVDGERGEEATAFDGEACHLLSLMHALSVQSIRGDATVDNLVEVR